MYDIMLYFVVYSTDSLLRWAHVSDCIPVLAIRPVLSQFILYSCVIVLLYFCTN